MVEEYKKGIEKVLEALLAEIDVPEGKYKDAERRYHAVADWLNAESSALAKYNPQIYAQGSFALGTVVKPLSGDYDIDVVCKLSASQDDFTQKELKNAVGDRLRENKTYKDMLDPKEGGRRCWTLKYADASKFHLDILPSIPDNPATLISLGVPPKHAAEALLITDKTQWESASWPKSNPKGYREWFVSRMRFRRQTTATAPYVFDSMRGEVEDVPEYQADSTLQKFVKLLKRHRDVRYAADEDKPISIIITTLAAKSYQGEDDLVSAFFYIIPRMRAAIEKRGNIYWISNPVDPNENFADKWAETPRKAKVFLSWLDAVQEEFKNIISPAWRKNVLKHLQDTFMVSGESFNAVVNDALDIHPQIVENSAQLIPTATFSVAHQQVSPWPIERTYRVSMTLRARSNERVPWIACNNGGTLQKGLELQFLINTDAPQPFDVYWQVVNTGHEALVANNLRGNITSTNIHQSGCLVKEVTKYTGRHWAICYIVKRGKCVARSVPFVVNVI